MLIVLSEIDCLDFLRSINVYPDEFYTDVDAFKNRSASFDNVDVVILLAGICRFSRRLMSELTTQMKKRIEDEHDSGVRSVYLLTDNMLFSTKEYYFYQGRPLIFKKTNFGTKENGYTDIWAMFKGEEKETKVHLYKEDTDKLASSIISKHDKDDDLLDMVQKPSAL